MDMLVIGNYEQRTGANCMTLAEALVYDAPGEAGEAHWNEEAKALIAGIILAIVTLFDVSAQYRARMLYPTPVDIIVELQMGLDGGLLPCARQNRVHALGHVERAAQAAETETRPVEPVGGSMAPLPGNLASEKKQAVSSAHSLTAGQPPLPPIRQGRGQEGQQ